LSDDAYPAHFLRAVGGGLVCLLSVFPVCFLGGSARAQQAAATPASFEPADYNTARFVLHTDLPESEAKVLLKRLDVTLKSATRLFGLPSRQPIESFVVERLDQWPAESFTHPAARLLIGGVGGGSVSSGYDTNTSAPRKATVFAAATEGIPEHEIVHAYCVQTFGQTGPTWFAEGIAEMLAHGGEDHAPVRCSTKVIDYLRGESPRRLDEIVGSDEFTAPLAASLITMVAKHESKGRLTDVVSMDQWNDEQAEIVDAARLSYHWCWSACHFLHQHPGYNTRFKLLARSYVAGNDVSFDEAFAPVRDQLDFEYRFFMERLATGYRVDLCAWDWRDPCLPKSGARRQAVKIGACRGYQATGVKLHKGDRVAFEASGDWQLSAESAALDADGDGFGQGQLEGVLFNAGELSEPFDLGQNGEFAAPMEGKLYLRCRDGWGDLADNRGAIRVNLRPADPRD
jgi:hypothetical protein